MRLNHQQKLTTVLTLSAALIGLSIGAASAEPFPALDPPVIERALPNSASPPPPAPQRSGMREWLLHKTSDGAHPNHVEQERLWLLNQARQDPTAEGRWLATTSHPDVVGGRNYFDVNLDLLRREFAAIPAKPPAAFDARLYAAAKSHSDNLIVRDAQDHNNQFDRVSAAGFHHSSAAGNVFAYSKSALNAHAALNIDWGRSPDGMQPMRSHRVAMMSLNKDYSNVGIAAVRESNAATNVGPLVMTDNFAKAKSNVRDHYNRFIVGTVWADRNGDGRYSGGEGFARVTVRPEGGTFFAVTAAGGGYAIPITRPGRYAVRFSGGALNVTRQVDVGANSVLLDLRVAPSGDSVILRDSFER